MKNKEMQLSEYRRQELVAFADGFAEIIESRFKDASAKRGRHPGTMEARLEVCLLEMAALCQFTPAESARFLLVLSLAIEEARNSALDRHNDGLVNDVIPVLARSILHHSSRRQRSK
jgi:hypothetical protein